MPATKQQDTMRHLIIDTNVIYQDYALNRSRINVLCKSSVFLNHKVFVPEVVVDEFIKQYKEELQAIEKDVKSLVKNGRKCMLDVDHLNWDFDSAAESYSDFLYRRLAEFDIVVIPYPKTLHKDIVARELSHRKPFKDSKKGYRDALIWESVKEHALANPDAEIVFISENSDDFSTKDKLNFHSDLTEDCLRAGIDISKLSIRTKLYDYIDKNMASQSKELEEQFEFIKDTDFYNNIEFDKTIPNYLLPDILDVYINSANYGASKDYIPNSYYKATISGISMKSLEYKSLTKISDTDVLLRCVADVDIDVNALINKYDYQLLPSESKPDVFDNNWNDLFYGIRDSAVFKLYINIVCDKDFMFIDSVDTEMIRAKYNTGYTFE